MLSVSSSQPADKPAPKDSSWASWLLIGIALAAVIALSPITVIPAVLVLHAPRPRPTRPRRSPADALRPSLRDCAAARR